ncbi:MAG TPA: inositol monophosphatase family protein [Gemmatimonadales bacterium]|jgi:myo-inositol-1(or 4)-monophosphatase|nr:inositol monophosphatase family protein [Gemmatimonadales bacterium]
MLSPLDLLDLARAAAERAAGFIGAVERPTDPAGWGSKGTRDFVTEVDRTAERMITEVLLAGDPKASIVGEEFTPQIVTDGLVWIVDPLDGTTNFLHDYPAYAVSIAAAVDGVLQAGVVHHIPAGAVYWATRGGGAWCGDRALRVSPIRSHEYALIGTGFPFKDLAQLAEYQKQFASVAGHTTGIRRAGSAALDLADVAAGRFEGFWEQRLSAWDIAAGTLLVREAGGRITDYRGRDLGIEHGPVVAGNPEVHAWLLRVLNGD